MRTSAAAAATEAICSVELRQRVERRRVKNQSILRDLGRARTAARAADSARIDVADYTHTRFDKQTNSSQQQQEQKKRNKETRRRTRHGRRARRRGAQQRAAVRATCVAIAPASQTPNRTEPPARRRTVTRDSASTQCARERTCMRAATTALDVLT